MSAAGSAVARIGKPQMRNLLNDRIKLHLGISMVLGAIGSLAFEFGIARPRKNKYAEFYKTYDIEKDFEEKRANKIFTSC